MHEILINRLGGPSLPRKSVVKLTDRPDMTLDVYRGRKTTMQQQQLKDRNGKVSIFADGIDALVGEGAIRTRRCSGTAQGIKWKSA